VFGKCTPFLNFFNVENPSRHRHFTAEMNILISCLYISQAFAMTTHSHTQQKRKVSADLGGIYSHAYYMNWDLTD